MSTMQPFVIETTSNISRANRLLSLKSNPGFIDLMRLSQELVDDATATSIDYPGWDPQQITVLKCRAQAAKEFHKMLIQKIQAAIQKGLEEQSALIDQLPEKSAREVLDQGDLARQEFLKKAAEMDNRPAGSY